MRLCISDRFVGKAALCILAEWASDEGSTHLVHTTKRKISPHSLLSASWTNGHDTNFKVFRRLVDGTARNRFLVSMRQRRGNRSGHPGQVKDFDTARRHLTDDPARRTWKDFIQDNQAGPHLGNILLDHSLSSDVDK